jgi:hypothetical protein
MRRIEALPPLDARVSLIKFREDPNQSLAEYTPRPCISGIMQSCNVQPFGHQSASSSRMPHNKYGRCSSGMKLEKCINYISPPPSIVKYEPLLVVDTSHVVTTSSERYIVPSLSFPPFHVSILLLCQ